MDQTLADGLEAYLTLLMAWNRKINLTGLSYSSSPDATVDRLLLEPLVAVKALPAGLRDLMDVGSGGGSPAIPMKLALGPAVRLLMVESKTRKAAFLREAVRQLKLEHVTVEAVRFEELLSRPELHESQDAVMVRAVRLRRQALMALQAFLRTGGMLVLFRGGGDHDAELAGMPPLEHRFTRPLLDAGQLVVYQKMPLVHSGGVVLPLR